MELICDRLLEVVQIDYTCKIFEQIYFRYHQSLIILVSTISEVGPK